MGERVVQAVASTNSNDDAGAGQRSWVRGKGREWVDEGSIWVEKVGSRYGVFGFEKKTKEEREAVARAAALDGSEKGSAVSAKIAGDAANAIVAYGLTKVSLVPWSLSRLLTVQQFC